MLSTLIDWQMQSLQQEINEQETQAAAEQKEVVAQLDALKQGDDMELFKDQQLQKQELQVLSVNYSTLNNRYKSLLQRHTLLLGAFEDAKNMTFDEYIATEGHKVVQSQVKAIQEEAETKIEAMQSNIKELSAENKLVKEANASVNNTISKKLEEIRKLEALIKILAMDTEKLSAKIQELDTVRDASDKALKESIQSLSSICKVLQEAQSQYNIGMKMFADEFDTFRKNNMRLSRKNKEKEDDKTAKQRIEPGREENYALPLNNTREGSSSAVFAPITNTELIQKVIRRTGQGSQPFGLDISKQQVTAIIGSPTSVCLYSEDNESEEILCTCKYNVQCLAWNTKGTLLAIGGNHKKNTNNSIQVWNVIDKKIIKRLKIKDTKQNCYCLCWNRDTITAGTNHYVYQWSINDRDNDEDIQGNKAVLPINTIKVLEHGYIASVQWSNCRSKFATMSNAGNMRIYNNKFNLTHQIQAYTSCNSYSYLQWCLWDNEVIATYCRDEEVKIWRIHKKIKIIMKIEHESPVTDIKWILGKKAILSTHCNNQLILWEYPNLSIIQIMKGHTDIPRSLAVNADESSIVSMSGNEIIIWKSVQDL